MTESKWLRFEEAQPNRKTKVWNVVAKDGGVSLGTISWFGRWRGYAFFPGAQLVFEKTCLRDIADFLERRNAEHRSASARARVDSQEHEA